MSVASSSYASASDRPVVSEIRRCWIRTMTEETTSATKAAGTSRKDPLATPSEISSRTRAAAERVEQRLAGTTDPTDRINAYLRAVGDELRPASAAFFDDVSTFPPASEVYERNTQIAAARVRELISEGVSSGSFREVPAAFVAEVVSSVMVRIQQRRISETTGLSDAEAYDELATLIVHGIRAQEPPHSVLSSG